MSFNLTITLTAVLIGLVSGAAGAGRHRGLAPAQLVVAVVVGAVGSAVALLATSAAKDNIFAIAHMGYLIVCISIPLAAAIMLVRANRAPIGGRVLLAIGLVPAVLGVYATHVEPFWLRVDRADVTGPASAAGLRIGVLADLQTGHIGEYESNAVDTLLAQNPDIVLIPGDFWQLRGEDFPERAAQFAAIMTRLSNQVEHVVAVDGNTDSVAGLRRITAGTDVFVLDNDFVDLDVDGRAVRVGGMSLKGDPAARSAVIDALAAADPDAATILLAHKPDVVYGVPDSVRVDVVVAGHTHGGQIQLPGIGPLTVLSSVPRSVGAGGLHTIEGQPIYVSTGVGRERNYAPQVRFLARPSVGILTFI